MGTGASKTASEGKTNKNNRQLKPARSKLRAAAALAKQSSVPGLPAHNILVKSKQVLLWQLHLPDVQTNTTYSETAFPAKKKQQQQQQKCFPRMIYNATHTKENV